MKFEKHVFNFKTKHRTVDLKKLNQPVMNHDYDSGCRSENSVLQKVEKQKRFKKMKSEKN